MRCLYCGKGLALLRKLTDGEFCSAAHRKRYHEEEDQAAIARLMHEAKRTQQAPAPLRRKPKVVEEIPPQGEFAVLSPELRTGAMTSVSAPEPVEVETAVCVTPEGWELPGTRCGTVLGPLARLWASNQPEGAVVAASYAEIAAGLVPVLARFEVSNVQLRSWPDPCGLYRLSHSPSRSAWAPGLFSSPEAAFSGTPKILYPGGIRPEDVGSQAPRVTIPCSPRPGRGPGCNLVDLGFTGSLLLLHSGLFLDDRLPGGAGLDDPAAVEAPLPPLVRPSAIAPPTAVAGCVLRPLQAEMAAAGGPDVLCPAAGTRSVIPRLALGTPRSLHCAAARRVLAEALEGNAAAIRPSGGAAAWGIRGVPERAPSLQRTGLTGLRLRPGLSAMRPRAADEACTWREMLPWHVLPVVPPRPATLESPAALRQLTAVQANCSGGVRGDCRHPMPPSVAPSHPNHVADAAEAAMAGWGRMRPITAHAAAGSLDPQADDGPATGSFGRREAVPDGVSSSLAPDAKVVFTADPAAGAATQCWKLRPLGLGAVGAKASPLVEPAASWAGELPEPALGKCTLQPSFGPSAGAHLVRRAPPSPALPGPRPAFSPLADHPTPEPRIPRIGLSLERNRGEARRAFVHPAAIQAQAWHGLSGFWKTAPSDLKWLAMVLPVVILVAAASAAWNLNRTPVKVAAGKGVAGAPVQTFFDDKWDGLRRNISRRAAISLQEDFRLGLADWEGRANWADGWQYDKAGFVLTGPLALYRPSLRLEDYSFEFLGQIENRSLNWVFRAADLQNYYAMKIVLTDRGGYPTGTIVRYTVLNGHAGAAVQKPLPVPIQSDTFCRIRVEVRGSDFAISLQDKIIDTWSDARLKSGGVGFFSQKGERARLRWLEVSHQYDAIGRLCALLVPYGMESTKTGWSTR